MMRSAGMGGQPLATKRREVAREGIKTARVAGGFQSKKPSTGFNKKTTFIVRSYYRCNR
jgi:hypothetical protein